MFKLFCKKCVDKLAVLKKANVLYVKKKYKSAIKNYAKILEVDSANFSAVANTATAYFELQDFAKSKKIPIFARIRYVCAGARGAYRARGVRSVLIKTKKNK